MNFKDIVLAANEKYFKDPVAFREKHLPKEVSELLDKQEHDYLMSQHKEGTIYED